MSIWIDSQSNTLYEVDGERCNVHIRNANTNTFVEECDCVIDECTGTICFATQSDKVFGIKRLIIPFLSALIVYDKDGDELSTHELNKQ